MIQYLRVLTRTRLKQYQQLDSKKFRQKYGLFIVEGLKSVQELLRTDFEVDSILCTASFDRDLLAGESGVECIDEKEFLKISQMENSQGILAVVIIPGNNIKKGSWEIALDRITDPGNLGAIMRIADWYGISSIVCEPGTVDPFNPKVIQSSMGSFLRVGIQQVNFKQYLKNKTVFAAVLDGQNIRKIPKHREGVILIGNEASGIDAELLADIAHIPVTIPGAGRAESLNAAIATAICCDRLIPL